MEERPSKSERKRRSDDLQSLGEALIDLPDSEFNALPLPEQLREAVQLARKITAHGGLYRQKQYIGKLMRKIDAEPIRDALGARKERGLGCLAEEALKLKLQILDRLGKPLAGNGICGFQR